MTNREAINILELQMPISHEDVRKAFRRMAKLHHPDLYREPEMQNFASQKFIAIRQASEWLLNKSEVEINAPEPIRKQPQPVKRHRKPAPAQSQIHTLPIFKEFENVISLFALLFAKKKERKQKKINWNLFPSTFMGKLYESLIEKKYPGEENMQGFSFAFLRFFRLLIGSIFLIAAFLILSILGLLGAVVAFPPLMVFYLLYSIYIAFLERIANNLNKKIKKNDLNSWIKVRKVYLLFRSIPLCLFLFASWATIGFGQKGTIYLQLISWLICIPVLLLFLSVLYEWIHYKEILRRTFNKNK